MILCKNISQIPKDVQYACLSKYIDKCFRLHEIAFFQWRNLYPHPKTHVESELLDLIKNRFIKLFTHRKPQNKMLEET